MATAGSIDIWLRLRTGSFTAAMAGVRRQMAGFYHNTQAYAARMEAMEGRTKALSIAIAAGLLVALRRLTRFMGSAISEFAKFEQQVAMVSTMLQDDAMGAIDSLSQSIVDLATQTGQSTETLSKGMYDILSASIHAKDAADVLRVAAMSATAGQTTTDIATKSLIIALKSYGLEADQVSRVSDLMFQTVKDGVFRFEDLEKNLGTVASTAKMAGLSMEGLLAAFATASMAGVPIEKIATGMRGVASVFLKPTEESIIAARRFGVELNTTTLRLQDLIGVLQQLKARGARAEDIAAIFPDRRMLATVSALYTHLDTYAQKIDNLRNVQGRMTEANQKMADTTTHTGRILSQMWAKFKRGAGEAFLAPVMPLVREAAQAEKAKLVEIEEMRAESARINEFYRAQAAAAATLNSKTIERIEAIRRLIIAYRELRQAVPETLREELRALEARLRGWLESDAAMASYAARRKAEQDKINERIDAERKIWDKQHDAITNARREIDKAVGMIGREGRFAGTLFDLERMGIDRRTLDELRSWAAGYERLAKVQQDAADAMAKRKADREELIRWSEELGESLKTPIQRFEDFVKIVKDALAAGVLDPAIARQGIRERLKMLAEQERTGGGEYRLPGAVESRFMAGAAAQTLASQQQQRAVEALRLDKERNKTLDRILAATKAGAPAVAGL